MSTYREPLFKTTFVFLDSDTCFCCPAPVAEGQKCCAACQVEIDRIMAEKAARRALAGK